MHFYIAAFATSSLSRGQLLPAALEVVASAFEPVNSYCTASDLPHFDHISTLLTLGILNTDSEHVAEVLCYKF
jgi:hypothetical protein